LRGRSPFGDPSGLLGAIVIAFVGAVIVRLFLESVNRR
jgi:hypothetical protein